MHDQSANSLACDESSYTKHLKDKKAWSVHISSDVIPILKLCIEWRMKNEEQRMKGEEWRRMKNEWMKNEWMKNEWMKNEEWMNEEWRMNEGWRMKNEERKRIKKNEKWRMKDEEWKWRMKRSLVLSSTQFEDENDFISCYEYEQITTSYL